MNSRDYFKDIYKDFFGVESESFESGSSNIKESQDVMATLFNRINSLYVSDESKELLKKMIEYMRKYHEGFEKNYIPFHFIIDVNNDDTKNEVIDILYNASIYFSYIESNKRDINLYDEKSFDFSSGFITISNLSGLNLIDSSSQVKFFSKLEDVLKNSDRKMIGIIGSSDSLVNFFLGRENIKKKYFDLSIVGISPDVCDIYEYIVNNVDLSESLKVELLDYITKSYDKNDDYVFYRNSLIRYISFNKKVPVFESSKSIDEVFNELNQLVGLDKVKKVLYELVDVINLRNKTDLSINNPNLHMVFLGNPGTGKTTVARIVANILYNLGYIKENKLIEVSSKDLVGQYVGQTAPKTMSVIEKSLNGVLFIDEAYSLAVKGDNSYNAEAIATLIQAMENYRDKLVVIFAGYTKEMQDFLNSNSGITSRIGYTLEFDDYNTQELILIFRRLMDKSGFSVNDDAISYLEEVINNNRNTKNFGNARFIRNIYEKTIIKHASNVKDKKQRKILKTITRDDISIDNLNLG